MNYKKIIYSLLLTCLFSYLWLHLNRNYITAPNDFHLEPIYLFTSTSSGFNHILSHASIYTLFFFMLLVLLTPQNMMQQLVRMTRKQFVLSEYKRLFYSAIHFSAIFLLVLTTFTTIFVEQEVLKNTNIYSGFLRLFFLITVYYFFIGSIFCLFRLLFTESTKAIVCGFTIAVGLLYLTKKYNVWTPVANIQLFDLAVEQNLPLAEFIRCNLKTIILIIALFFITYFLFQQKDVLHEKY